MNTLDILGTLKELLQNEINYLEGEIRKIEYKHYEFRDRFDFERDVNFFNYCSAKITAYKETLQAIERGENQNERKDV